MVFTGSTIVPLLPYFNYDRLQGEDKVLRWPSRTPTAMQQNYSIPLTRNTAFLLLYTYRGVRNRRCAPPNNSRRRGGGVEGRAQRRRPTVAEISDRRLATPKAQHKALLPFAL